MLLIEFTKSRINEEDSWSGPNNAWHNQGQDDQWYNGQDQWHGNEGAGMVEDIDIDPTGRTVNTEMSDIIQAKQLASRAISNPAARYEYFNFLKHLRSKYGPDYSTHIHQKVSTLIQQR